MNRLYARLRSWLQNSKVPAKAGGAVAPPVLSGPRDRAVAALLYAIYFTMVAFTGFAVYVVFFIIISPPSAPPPPRARCEEDRAESCPPGKTCEDGECVTLLTPDCKDGDSCDACSCNLPMVCSADNLCRVPLAPTPIVCNEKLVTLVKHLIAYQEKCIEDAKGKSLANCPTENVADFLLSHEDFESLLNTFPDGLLVMFPNGQPGLAAAEESETTHRAWPDPVTFRAYAKPFLDNPDHWLNAGYIISIGRASPGRTKTEDFNYAHARVRFIRGLMVDVLAPTTPTDPNTTKRAELGSKFIEFVLGADRPLKLASFSVLPQTTVWWDAGASRGVSQALVALKSAASAKSAAPATALPQTQSLSQEAQKLAERDLNRSVAVFAVPRECVRAR